MSDRCPEVCPLLRYQDSRTETVRCALDAGHSIQHTEILGGGQAAMWDGQVITLTVYADA